MTKILVIRFSSIGDIVLTSPVIRALKMQLNKPEIHALTKEANGRLYETNTYVDKVFTLGKDDRISRLIKTLRNERYDYVIDLHNNLRSWHVRVRLGARSSGFPKLNIRKYLLVSFKWNIMPQLHVVDRYFMAVRKLGVKNDGKGLDFFLPENSDIQINRLKASCGNGFYAIVIGGQHYTKLFPVQKLIQTIPLLDLPVVLLGGSEDVERADMISSQTGDQVINLVGALNLFQSASVIWLSTAVLTNDTGLMHIAAAFRKPIVSVWGNTVPVLGMYPYMPESTSKSVIIQNNQIRCRPCSKIGYSHCPKGHFKCMMDLDVNEIAIQLKQVSAR